jgi:hypothetical protein
VWAWDGVEKEPVLIFPWVLALLGDNPMQSELASHIGMRGKLFCRACWVKGSDALAAAADATSSVIFGNTSNTAIDDETNERGMGEGSEGGSDTSNDGSSIGSSNGEAGPKRKKKFVETMAQIVERVSTFMKVVCATSLYTPSTDNAIRSENFARRTTVPRHSSPTSPKHQSFTPRATSRSTRLQQG